MKLKFLFISPKAFFLNLMERFFKKANFEIIRYGHERIVNHPWDFPELILLEYLKSKKKIKLFIIGAYVGNEVERLLKTGGISKIFLFEPNPKTIDLLKLRMRPYKKYIEIIKAAVSNKDGNSIFYETNRVSSSSILKVSDFGSKSYNLKINNKYNVKTITLDSFVKEKKEKPNVLWIDVQGAEMMVLNGAKNILYSIDLIFIEVSIWKPLYQKGATMDKIEIFLNRYGFRLSQLGTDLQNGTGNALFTKNTYFL